MELQVAIVGFSGGKIINELFCVACSDKAHTCKLDCANCVSYVCWMRAWLFGCYVHYNANYSLLFFFCRSFSLLCPSLFLSFGFIEIASFNIQSVQCGQLPNIFLSLYFLVIYFAATLCAVNGHAGQSRIENAFLLSSLYFASRISTSGIRN